MLTPLFVKCLTNLFKCKYRAVRFPFVAAETDHAAETMKKILISRETRFVEMNLAYNCDRFHYSNFELVRIVFLSSV